ncbi:MAG: GNAT family N-acetyltransferase [Candidatus Hydrogenedentes bacterium]|nr:GNAT family N-acetyltransferase [Candidatus Hydrogenedentota bacterium]
MFTCLRIVHLVHTVHYVHWLDYQSRLRFSTTITNLDYDCGMLHLRRIKEVPPNYGEFVDEVAAGLAGLYGPPAAEEYRCEAVRLLQTALGNPLVDAVAFRDGSRVAALLLAVLRDSIGQISFLHVLRRYLGRSLEARLIEEAVATFQAGGVEAIVSECVTFSSLNVDDTYQRLGFEKIERLLMSAPLNEPSLQSPSELESVVYTQRAWPALADVIAEAYREHPDRRLHFEVRNPEAALQLVRNCAAGIYGAAEPEFVRAVHRDGRPVAAILGCRAAPGVGFVLQLAVRPEFRRQGIGSLLLRESAEVFRRRGYDRIALGVTRNNPARRLYESLGFDPKKTVDAYVWWRP